jgi:hypothetical protein
MHTHHCLASIAELELNALVQDAKIAVGGLQRQRESVAQAIESIQVATKHSGQPPDEVLEQAGRLVEALNCLEAALDQVMLEIKQVEKTPLAAEPLVALPLCVTLPSRVKHSMAEINLHVVSQTSLNSHHSGNR